MEGDDEPPPSPLFVEGGAPAFSTELVPSGGRLAVTELRAIARAG